MPRRLARPRQAQGQSPRPLNMTVLPSRSRRVQTLAFPLCSLATVFYALPSAFANFLSLSELSSLEFSGAPLSCLRFSVSLTSRGWGTEISSSTSHQFCVTSGLLQVLPVLSGSVP